MSAGESAASGCFESSDRLSLAAARSFARFRTSSTAAVSYGRAASGSVLSREATSVESIRAASSSAWWAFGFRMGQDSAVWGGRLRTASWEVELGEVAAVYYRRPTPYAARFANSIGRDRTWGRVVYSQTRR
jgi:hypothetical protein